MRRAARPAIVDARVHCNVRPVPSLWSATWRSHMYTTSTTASSDPSLAALNFLPAAPQGNTPQELIDNGGFDAALYQTLPGLLNLSGGDDDFAHLTVPNSQD